MGAHRTTHGRILCANAELRSFQDDISSKRAALAATEASFRSRCQTYADWGMTRNEMKEVLGTDPPDSVTFQ